MAITYNLNIDKIGESNHFSIGATVTDDTKVVGHQTENVAVLSAKLDTSEQKQAAWDSIELQYLAKVVESDVLIALETEGKNYLETK